MEAGVEQASHSPPLRGVVQLIDIRRDPSDDDLQMLDFLADVGAPTIVAVTKTDKLSAGAVAARIADITAALGIDTDRVSVKFKTAETVGPVGEGRSAEAQAVVTLER